MSRLSKAFLAISIFAAGLVAPATSSAYDWPGIETGTIGQIHVSPGDNYGFRVYFTDGRKMCRPVAGRTTDGAANWAFLNDTDSNYKVYVAMLMMAKATGSTVTIYTNNEPYGTDGTMCRIGYVVVN